MAVRVLFEMKSVKADNGGKFTAVASSLALDREMEVLIPRGMLIENFMVNPVMLLIHNYRELAVGKVLAIRVTDEIVEIDFEFADTDEGRKLRYLYENGFMRAFSVGFYPYKWIDLEETSDIKEIVIELPDGKTFTLDVSKYKIRPRRIISQWELLEVSPVPVPANPEAVLRSELGAQLETAFTGSVVRKAFAMESIESIINTVKSMLDNVDTMVPKGAVPFTSTPVSEKDAWDQADARSSLAAWASSDGTGNKDTIDWAKYAKGFTWFDESKTDAFTSYKLPHHVVESGSLKLVPKGLYAAMAALNGARGGADVGDDKQAVYNHLARHYRDLDMEPPELKEYTEDELKVIEEKGVITTEPAPSSPSPPPDQTRNNELGSRIDELEQTLLVRLNVLSGMVMEFLDSRSTAPTNPVSPPPTEEEAQAKMLSDMLSEVFSLSEH